MKTVRRLLYRDIVWSVVFVALAFLSLFFFIDFVDELENVGRNGYTLGQAVLRAALPNEKGAAFAAPSQSVSAF